MGGERAEEEGGKGKGKEKKKRGEEVFLVQDSIGRTIKPSEPKNNQPGMRAQETV